MRLFCKSKKENKKQQIEEKNINRFQRYMSLTNNNFKKEYFSKNIISVIVEYLNFQEAIQSLEFKHESQDNSLINEIYSKLNCLMGLELDIKSNIDCKFNIKEKPILLNAWKGERILENLETITDKNMFDCDKYSHNIQNDYLIPMGIVVCKGANHSQFSAKLKGQNVKTKITQIYNYSKLYDFIYFNGEQYVRKNDDSVLKLNYDKELLFYSGVIFELSRNFLKK